LRKTFFCSTKEVQPKMRRCCIVLGLVAAFFAYQADALAIDNELLGDPVVLLFSFPYCALASLPSFRCF
jgi:hypothetical protein